MFKKFQISHRIYSYLLLALVLFAAISIVKIEVYNLIFLIALTILLFLCLRYRNLFDNGSVFIARSLVGLLFIFSGFVKGVDPLGTQYVIHDYLEAYQMPFFQMLALPASFFLNMLEFCVGVLVLFNVKIRFTATLAALMMLFFTGLTWYDAVANPVPDCGCFGKAIVLTNWQTFYKNLVLDCLVIILFFSATRIRYRFSSKIEYSIIAVSIVLFLGFEFYNYKNLPLIDFLDWKEGKRMLIENPKPIKYYVTYKNKANGQEKEYLLSECPYNDPSWAAEWEFVSRRDEDPNPKTTQISLLSRTFLPTGEIETETD
ncbi:MAG: DoxX family protein, partial [Bacteroidales bacterium]